MKSRSEEDALLLAYYFGNVQILNCAALQSITSDLIDNFWTSPNNNSTKYSGHIDGCCICHEKEVLFKRALKNYHQASAATNLTISADHPDLDDCWKDVKKMWEDHEIALNWDEEPVGYVIGNYQVDCQQLLFKHQVFLLRASTQRCEKRWKNLLTSIKGGLENCMESIAKINRGELNITPLPSQCTNFSKKKLRNTYLTLKIPKSARTQAKFLQSCREIGVQIRAAREPISVVCKYMICGRCLEKPKRHEIVNVTDILKYSVMDFPTTVPYNKLPDCYMKLRSEKIKAKAIARARSKPSVEVTFGSPNRIATNGTVTFCSPNHVAANGTVTFCSPSRVAPNGTVNGGAFSKGEPIYILKNSPPVVFNQPGTNSLKRKLAMPVAETKKFRLPSGSRNKESLNVVIVGNNHQTTTPVTSLVLPDPNGPTISKSPQPINIKSLTVINTQIKSPTGTTTILSTHRQIPVQNMSNNSMRQSEGLSVTRINPQSVLQPSLAPVMEMRKISTKTSIENAPKKPFVVQIIDSKLKNPTTLIKEFKSNQPVPVIKTIPLSNSGIKFVKAVSLPNQIPKTPPSAILVKGLQFPNSTVTPGSATTILGRKGLHAMRPVKVVSSQLKTNISKGVLYSNGKFNATFRPVNRIHSLGQPITFFNMKTAPPPVQHDGSKKPGSSQLKVANRTPSKKRSKVFFPSKPVSTVVAEYLLSLTPTADEGLWKKLKTRSKRRWEKSSSLIPVPYETHYLCIDNTIKKLGWKAYWYRKCRCSKIREKSAGMDNDDDDFSKGHSIEDIKGWIPAAVTVQMREELAIAFEREDKYTSPTTNGCSTSKETIVVEGNNVSTPKKINDKTEVDLSRVKLEFDPPIPMPSTMKPAEPYSTVSEQSNSKSQPLTNDKAPTITLKAKYCRGKNGLWKSMNESVDGSPLKELHGDDSHSNSMNSVKLNLSGAFVEEVKDSMEYSSVDGVRRCPRATMLRRKSLIDRAERFERNTKAKRQRTEAYATENFMFSSTCNSSAHQQGFSVVSPHPVVFKECEDLQALFQVIINGKSSAKLNVCKQQANNTCEKVRQEKYYENIVSSIMQNATANVNDDKSKPKTKNQKCQLLSELQVAWDKSNADHDSNTNPDSNRQGPMKKRSRKCIMHIKPELMYNSLQILRGVSSSEPSTNVISKESAQFILSALKTSNNTNSSKLKPSDIPKKKTVDLSSIVGVKRSNDEQQKSRVSEIMDVKRSNDEQQKSRVSEIMDVKRSNDEQQKSHISETIPISTPSAEQSQPCDDNSKNDASPTVTVIPKTNRQMKENCGKNDRKKRLNNSRIKVPSMGAILYKLNNPLPYQNSQSQCKKLTDEWWRLASFQGKLSRHFKSCQTLSCMLGSSSVLKLEEDLMDWNEHYIDDPKLRLPDDSNSTVQVNKRKRRASLIHGVQGLDGSSDDTKVVTRHEIQEKCVNGPEFSYERPMSCLLSKDLDVTSLKNCMWETTSARPIGLHCKYYTKGNGVGTPKKLPLDRPRVDNASKIQDQKSVADPTPVVPPTASEPENTNASYLRKSLMLIKPSPRKNPLHKRPQGISHARMMRLPCVPQNSVQESDELDGDASVGSKGFTPSREVSGDELLRILQPRRVRSSERLKRNEAVNSPKDCTNVQMLRETVFAELQSRKKRRCAKEDVNENESNSSERKLNRFSTNGHFISRLLQFDSENFFDNP